MISFPRTSGPSDPPCKVDGAVEGCGRAGGLFGFAAGVLELISRPVPLIDQHTVVAIAHQAKLNRDIHVAALRWKALDAARWAALDDQRAAFGQRVVGQGDIRIQRVGDRALQRGTACVIGIDDASRPVVIGYDRSASGDADHESKPKAELFHRFVRHGNMILFVSQGDFVMLPSLAVLSNAPDLLFTPAERSDPVGHVPLAR